MGSSADSSENTRPNDAQEEPTHNADGVDLTLIRRMLDMTPAERLRYLEGHIAFLKRAREHGQWRPAR